MSKLTVIIPIYDGLEEIDTCLRSLVKSKNDNSFDIFLINDNPKNKLITQLLEKFENRFSNIRVLTNKENMGFSSSVNNGIEHCSGDVVILNSDTTVADGLIDKFYQLSLLRDDIGTISSLTNNGTILSIPKYNTPSELPSNFDIKEYQTYIDYLLKNKIHLETKEMLVKIPTPVGHCMLVTRNVIDSVGMFDSKTFGIGYGEENDFGERAKRNGFKNYAALNIFVSHKGSVSFKDSKVRLIKEHERIIRKKYPFFKWTVRLFVLSNNPIKKLCELLKTRGQYDFSK